MGQASCDAMWYGTIHGRTRAQARPIAAWCQQSDMALVAVLPVDYRVARGVVPALCLFLVRRERHEDAKLCDAET